MEEEALGKGMRAPAEAKGADGKTGYPRRRSKCRKVDSLCPCSSERGQPIAQPWTLGVLPWEEESLTQRWTRPGE